MIDIILLFLQILLIIITIAIVLHKENFTLVILIASFGLIAATLYVMNQAPDVAIAEVAIGSAIIPLIYVISISRQREFIVLDRVNHNMHDLDEMNVVILMILKNFVNNNNLRLNLTSDNEGNSKELLGELKTDLIISYNNELKQFELKGKASSILITKLKDMTADYSYINVIALEEGEGVD